MEIRDLSIFIHSYLPGLSFKKFATETGLNYKINGGRLGKLHSGLFYGSGVSEITNYLVARGYLA